MRWILETVVLNCMLSEILGTKVYNKNICFLAVGCCCCCSFCCCCHRRRRCCASFPEAASLQSLLRELNLAVKDALWERSEQLAKRAVRPKATNRRHSGERAAPLMDACDQSGQYQMHHCFKGSWNRIGGCARHLCFRARPTLGTTGGTEPMGQ